MEEIRTVLTGSHSVRIGKIAIFAHVAPRCSDLLSHSDGPRYYL